MTNMLWFHLYTVGGRSTIKLTIYIIKNDEKVIRGAHVLAALSEHISTVVIDHNH